MYTMTGTHGNIDNTHPDDSNAGWGENRIHYLDAVQSKPGPLRAADIQSNMGIRYGKTISTQPIVL